MLTLSFMFALCFVQGASELFADASLSVEDRLRAWNDYGTIGRTLMTVFISSTGGADWDDLATPMKQAGIVYYMIFCVWQATFLFIIMNCLTSLFVDATLQVAAKDEELLINDQLAQKQEYMAKLVSLFHALDRQHTGLISHEDFLTHMSDPRMAGFAASLELDDAHLEQMFTILSHGGEQGVDLETFVMGCIKLKGNAKSVDVLDILQTLKALERVANRQQKEMHIAIKELHKATKAELVALREWQDHRLKEEAIKKAAGKATAKFLTVARNSQPGKDEAVQNPADGEQLPSPRKASEQPLCAVRESTEELRLKQRL